MKKAAATDIQRVFRGHRARQASAKNLSSRLMMARRRLKSVTALRKASPVRRSVSPVLKHSAAINIQRAFRGFKNRKNFAYKKAAVTDIQRAFREYKKKTPAWLSPIKNFAARNIQRVYRGHRARKTLPVKSHPFAGSANSPNNKIPSHAAMKLKKRKVVNPWTRGAKMLSLGLLAASAGAMSRHRTTPIAPWRPYT